MLKYCLLIIYGCIQCISTTAQSDFNSTTSDSVLKEVVVHAYHAGMRWKEVPASVALVSSKDLGYYATPSFVPILNRLPGVRMEERSPGSYRLSLRGSSLRAPFGVRNIKVYWNEIPLSDATGNTYLNLLELQSVNQIEVAKGPASSIYGAGTGGAILFNQSLRFSDSLKHSFTVGSSVGSFNLNQQQVEWVMSNQKYSSSLQVNRLVSDGYREQSFLEKKSIIWQTSNRLSNGIVNTLFFLTDLNYGTPGGITFAQMKMNPRLSRQPTATLPGAVQQKTAVFNQTVFGAVNHQFRLNDRNSIKWFASINRTNFANPFITNYEKRVETNINVGLQHIYLPFNNNQDVQWVNGVELLLNESQINNYTNNAGNPGSIISTDFIFSKQQFFFSQLKWKIAGKLNISVGFSINNQLYDYKRLSDPIPFFTTRKMNAPFVPRVSFSYPIKNDLFVYGIIAQGFSSPSLAEVRPSDGNFYPFLEAEKGWNFELGLKGSLFQNKILIDLSLYQFKLKDAIVRRNDLAGAEYFVNAGSTLQKGIELLLTGNIINSNIGLIRKMTLNGALSYQPYRFLEFQQGQISFKGNAITGVPKSIVVLGFQMNFSNEFYLNASLNATGKIPLNDVNTVFADPYQLVQAKLGKIIHWKKTVLDLYVGGDNLLNQVYSLGNDINAAGSRFFNPAPSKNYIAGIRINFQ